MVTEESVDRAKKTVYEGTENDAWESFVSRDFWLHFSRLELTFYVILFFVKLDCVDRAQDVV